MKNALTQTKLKLPYSFINWALWDSITGWLLLGLDGTIEKMAGPTLRGFILSLFHIFSDVIRVNIADAPCFFYLFFASSAIFGVHKFSD